MKAPSLFVSFVLTTFAGFAQSVPASTFRAGAAKVDVTPAESELPKNYEGILDAPAMSTNFSGIGDRWVAATLNEVAPTDDKGVPNTREALSESQKKLS